LDSFLCKATLAQMISYSSHRFWWAVALCAIVFVWTPAQYAASGETVSNPVYGGTEDGKWSGSRVYFGRYEQDNDLYNGPEQILWRVLQITDDTVTLLSEYGLDTMQYHDRYEEITWENCTLRAWLNGTFHDKAFDSDEQRAILNTYNPAVSNPYYRSDAGNDTIDRVYLLSWDDVGNPTYGFDAAVETTNSAKETVLYSEVSDTRTCQATRYAIARHALVTRKATERKDVHGNHFETIGTGYWCLRTPKQDQRFVAYVSRWGRTTIGKEHSPVDHEEPVTRPAITLDRHLISFERANDSDDFAVNVLPLPRVPEGTALRDVVSNPTYGGNARGKWEGNRILFGAYTQKANEAEGKDPVLWRILAVERDRALLLSEYSLTARAFDEESNKPSWEESPLREWMNGNMFKELFSEHERIAALMTDVESLENPRYKTKFGGDTQDILFLLDASDTINPAYGFEAGQYNEAGNFYYGGYSDTRTCIPTPYALQNGANYDTVATTILDSLDNAFSTQGNSGWWLRTPGLLRNNIMSVDSFGDFYFHEMERAFAKKVAIRPAIWIDLSRLVVSGYNEEGHPMVSVAG